MDLAERLGAFLAQVCGGALERVEVGLYGDLREIDLKPILAGGRAGRAAAQPGRRRSRS